MHRIIILSIIVFMYSDRVCSQISITPLVGIDYLRNPDYEWGYYTHISNSEFNKPIYVFGGQISYSFSESFRLTSEALFAFKKRMYYIDEFQGFVGGYNKIEFGQGLYSLSLEKRVLGRFSLGLGVNLLNLGLASKISVNDALLKKEVRNSSIKYLRPRLSLGYKLNQITIQSYLMIGLSNINLPEPEFTHGKKINFGVVFGYRLINVSFNNSSSSCPEF